MTDQQARQVESLLPQIGQAVGGPIGGAIGTVLDVIGGLLGGKTHYTPSGATYSESTGAVRDQEAVINQLWTRLYGAPLDATVPPVGDTPAWFGYMTGLVARYLNNPALQTTDGKQLDVLKKNGSFDQAGQVQRQLIQALNAKLAQGPATPAANAATPPVTAAAGTVQAAAAAAAGGAGLLASVESAIPATIFGINTTYVLIGGLALIVLAARR